MLRTCLGEKHENEMRFAVSNLGYRIGTLIMK
jgi:hypothetical protein